MKATGIVRRIDELGRIVIPKEIRRTQRIRRGDPLEIFTSADGEVVFKKYSPVAELSAMADQYVGVLARQLGVPSFICDRDSIIAIAGGAKRELLDKPISAQLSEIMENRSTFRHSGVPVPVSSADEKYCLAVASPVITEGDVMGCVLFVSEKGSANPGEVEYKLAQTVAAFLGKQMES